MTAENIKVAVRVRGFNRREQELKSECVIEMKDSITKLKTPSYKSSIKDAEKLFAFDYSYWSFDGFKTEPSGYLAPQAGSRYVDQRKIFEDLGKGMLQNAFNGYNASLFAYGQTGSGKSYCLSGYGANKGLIPNICEALFHQIEQKKMTASSDDLFEVSFSMVEIYNEVIRDLLTPKRVDRKGLQLHEMPGKGFKKKDLKPVPVLDFQAIQKLIDRGNQNKTIAETKMNATSSRAHTIVELVFKQTYRNETGSLMQRVSNINLVDLAGSERVDKTGATGERMKEGISINLSLSSLGNCIAALAQQSSGNHNVKVPYRDSILTKLLMNALGGNSKTVMIVTISPSDNNYDETLSSLRYADRAKSIKCKAIVNEDPKDKLIRQLQEEINNLKSQIKAGLLNGVDYDGLNQSDYEKAKRDMEESIRRRIEENEREMDSLRQSYEQRLAEAHANAKEIDRTYQVTEKAKICPHLANVNIDSNLTGSLKFLIEFGNKKSSTMIGSSDKVEIQLSGLGVNDRHAAISNQNGTFFIEPFGHSRVILNGKQIEEKSQLNNLDRLVLGASNYFIFVDPARFGQEDSIDLRNEKISSITVEKIQQEIAESMGLISQSFDRRAPEEQACINQLIDLMPYIEEANQMSIILDKKMKYQPLILNPIVIGDPYSKIKPVIVAKKFGTSYEWLYDSDKFIDKKTLMSEIYLDLKEEGKIDEKKLAKFDPFMETETEPVLIGIGIVEHKCVLHRIPLEDNPKVYDYLKRLVGSFRVELIPCDKQGIAYDNIGNHIILDPHKQLKQLHYIVRIKDFKSISGRFKRIYAQFKVYGQEDWFRTEVGDTSFPDFQTVVSFDAVDADTIKHFSTYPLFVQILGNQYSARNDAAKLSTRDWFEKDKKDNKIVVTPEAMRDEIAKLTKELDKLRGKLKNVETLVNYAEKRNKRRVRVEYVRECLLAQSPDVVARVYDMMQRDKSQDK